MHPVTEEVKLRNGRILVPVTMTTDGDRIYLKFPFSEKLKNEVKEMEGARWHPESKQWSVSNTRRNMFCFEYLKGNNPYKAYEAPLAKISSERPLYSQQIEMSSHMHTRKQCIVAAEMGCGKTLSFIEAAEASGLKNWWYVAPKVALEAVKMDFRRWKSKIQPIFMSYERMAKHVKQMDLDIPQGICFDECQKLKTPTAIRTQAALTITELMRKAYDDPYIILMSGSPAPKSPKDWWSLCEIARPGFIKEGNIHKFTNRLAIVAKRESITGGAYNHIVAWRSSVELCDVCGHKADHELHQDVCIGGPDAHPFRPTVNEVERLYKRMNGLVFVKFKKDCLDLPDKVYKPIYLTPSNAVKAAAKIITRSESNGAQALIKLRELSDGFQYVQIKEGKKTCPGCHGTGIDHIATEALGEQKICANCNGEKEVDNFIRGVRPVDCPKVEALRELLDEHDDYRRIVIYAGFTASVDRCVEICKKAEWSTIRVDGRGWDSKYEKPLEVFQSDSDERIAFIGHPGSAGTGLTLTKSPSIVYYSNDFNAEYRIQSEDRIHRIGMDVNRGATIYDLFHLPTDELVFKNLQEKRLLQSISMGELRTAIGE